MPRRGNEGANAARIWNWFRDRRPPEEYGDRQPLWKLENGWYELSTHGNGLTFGLRVDVLEPWDHWHSVRIA